MKPTTTAEAHLLKLRAKGSRARVRDFPDHNPTMNCWDLRAADDMDAAADALLALPAIPETGTGGEMVPPKALGHIGTEDAVRRPDAVELQASIERVTLADQCGAFNLAFDAAESIKARNSTERMLAHQMAAAHKAALDLLAKSAQQRDTIEQARLANTAARLMDTYQRAMLTLARTRSGGKQTVVVQHVQVAGGAQAVITGTGGVGGRLSENGT